MCQTDTQAAMSVDSLKIDAGLVGSKVGPTRQTKCTDCSKVMTGKLEEGTDFLSTGDHGEYGRDRSDGSHSVVDCLIGVKRIYDGSSMYTSIELVRLPKDTSWNCFVRAYFCKQLFSL